MSLRLPAALAVLTLFISFHALAVDDAAQARTINLVPSAKGASLFPLKNPGVVTLGTLVVNGRIDFAISAFTTNGNGVGGALSYLWNWGDGTPPGSGPFPNHTYVVAGTYTVTVTTTEAGNPTPLVSTLSVTVTDSIQNSKLLTNERWSSPGGDSLLLFGVVHVPINQSIAGQTAFFDVGGIQLSFRLDGKGTATLTSNTNVIVDPVLGTSTSSVAACKASVKFVVRRRANFLSFADVPFTLRIKNAAFSPALADEFITNRTAVRDSVRISAKLTIFNILFSSGINQLYLSKQGGTGKTR